MTSISTSASNKAQFGATLFDGLSAQGADVRVEFCNDGSLSLYNQSGFLRQVSKEQIIYEPPVGRAPLLIKFKDGTLLQASYDDAIVEKLSILSSPQTNIIRILERRPSLILGVCAAATAFMVLLYLYGVPIAVKIVHPFVPEKAKKLVGEQVISFLDSHILHPSKVPAATADSMKQGLTKLLEDAQEPIKPNVLFRILSFGEPEKGKKSTGIANAVAVLPETIIITDGLVEKLSQQEAEAVLAHEIGHLAHDHGTQILLRSSLIAGGTLFIFGPDPGIIQSIGLAILETSYSRDQETQADEYAVKLLKRANRDPLNLASALEKLTENDEESSIDKYASSHPATSERVKKIKEWAQ